jgi:alpha-methylacyl-CoA racemase
LIVGPLSDFRIIEIGSIGPGPFCGMLLADMGADVLRIERPGHSAPGADLPRRFQLMNRGRPAITLDLKTPAGVRRVLELCKRADALFEGNRPGVMEKLGLGPDVCMAVNPRLVYGRMTGWGQQGPLAPTAGHDANYAAVSGAIGAIGPRDGPPVLPLNLVADFGGGGAYLAIGLLAALLEAQRSGKGQVVDAAMVDGAASLMTLFYGLLAAGAWKDQRGSNLLDGAAPFYRPYRTKDGEYVVVCAIEPQFFAELLEKAQIDEIDAAEQFDSSRWAAHIAILERKFEGESRDHWASLFAGSDACVAPVLSLREAPAHPHNRERETFIEIDGVLQPAPAPRFSRTQSAVSRAGLDSEVDRQILEDVWGMTATDIGHNE